MITKEEICTMLQSTETYRVEKTISTTNMDKFCEAICAFANDLPDSRKKGYLFIGVNDDGTLSGLKVDDGLLKKIAAIRSDGNILPLPTMSVERFEFPDGDLLVAEVSPVVDPEILSTDKRDIKEQLASIRLYDRKHDCPTYAALILFGKNPRYFMPGAYVQYVRFAGNEKGGAVLNEKRFHGPLFSMIPALESFTMDAIVTQRPVAVSLFREKTVINYPNNALRELLMNACMHRDYQSNMPIRLYQFDDYIEIMNAGGLYGEARPENFPMVNDYRNPIVAEAMKEMKYVNMFNQGVSRVQEMLRENGNQEAVFDVSKLTVFSVTVHSNVEFVSETQTINHDGTQDVPQDVPQAIIDLVSNNPKITREEIAKQLGISSKTVGRHLKKLSYCVRYIGKGYSGHWEVLEKTNDKL